MKTVYDVEWNEIPKELADQIFQTNMAKFVIFHNFENFEGKKPGAHGCIREWGFYDSVVPVIRTTSGLIPGSHGEFEESYYLASICDHMEVED